jgi:hypothetical protein
MTPTLHQLQDWVGKAMTDLVHSDCVDEHVIRHLSACVHFLKAIDMVETMVYEEVEMTYTWNSQKNGWKIHVK